MPPINITKCDHCGLAFPIGWGSYTYATDDSGHRIVCGHPDEMEEVRAITGMEWSEARAASWIGHASHCMCFDCAEQFDLDLDRDVKKCPVCGSLHVRSAHGAVAEKCPRCKTGVFREEWTGGVS